MRTYIWIVVCVYFIITIVIGFMANRTLKGKDDSSGYFLGGKSFGPIFPFKFATTFESGSSMISQPGSRTRPEWSAFNSSTACPCVFSHNAFIRPPRQVACDHFDTITVPQLLSKRYNSRPFAWRLFVVVISMGGTLGTVKAMQVHSPS